MKAVSLKAAGRELTLIAQLIAPLLGVGRSSLQCQLLVFLGRNNPSQKHRHRFVCGHFFPSSHLEQLPHQLCILCAVLEGGSSL